MNRPVKDVRTVRANGEDAFYVVDLEGGGFVVTAADDRIEPIVAFADEGTLVEDSKNPLWALLNLDMPQRVKAHKAGKAKGHNPSKLRGRGRHRRWKEPSVEWRELTADDDAQTQTTAQISSVSDVRVDALVQSTWNQSTVGSKTCYNYYTPNGYVCGCVATAGAQLMRFHRFPVASVTPVTKSCWIDDEAADRTMMGGVYDWANMPLSPSSSSLTDAQRQAIGKLCYDVGVSTRMDWTKDGSGACPAVLAESLVSVFGYANAKCEMSGSMSAEKTEDAIYANLDAGFPVLLGIHASNGGHEIVADGYGVYNDVIYTHLNLGWSGGYNAWYALPSVSAGGYDFTTLSSIVYNVFPKETGELLTGRVLDANDKPIAGATVTAVNGSTTRTATSNASGIYVLNVTSGKTWALTVSAAGYVTAQKSESVGTSKSSGLGTVNATSYSYYNNGSVGNSWGNDITLEEAMGNTLQSIEVNGPSSVCKGTKATYVCAARYSDGSLKPVTAKSWSISGNTTTTGWWIFKRTMTHATLDGGVLTASSAKTGISITATYEIGGKTYNASATMSVVSSSAAPANDMFSYAVAIGGSTGSRTVDTGNATDESGEPLLKSVPSATGTAWWKWTAPADGVARFNTSGSSIDAVLGVYRGSSLSGLTTVGEKGVLAGECAFFCSKGEEYYVVVGGWCGTRGNIALNWRSWASLPVPTANDFVYDGAEHRGVDANALYALSGTFSAKDAGAYRATAMPKDGYCWPDGSTGPTDVAWSIDRAPLVVTATNAAVIVGENPVFGAVCEGFVAGEDEMVLDGAIEFSCAYEPQQAKAGETYAIVPVAQAANYDIASVAGELTVVPDLRLRPGGSVGVDVAENPTQKQIEDAIDRVAIVIADPAAEAAGQKHIVRKAGAYNEKTGKVEVWLEIDETAETYVNPDEIMGALGERLAEVTEGEPAVTVAPKNLTKGLYYSILGAGGLDAFGRDAVEGDRVLAAGSAITLPIPKVPGRAAFFRILQNLTQKP